MKKNSYISWILPAITLLASCQREEVPQSGPVGFAVTETIPDFRPTKAETAPWSTQAGDYTLTVSEQWLPLSGADTKASKIYREADSSPLQGDPIAVWAYNMPAAGSAVSAWLVDGGSPSPVQASYNSSSDKWVSSVSFNTSKRAASYYTRWFAVAPWAALGGGATVSTLTNGQAPVLSYTVPAAVSGQHDLMVATPTAARAIDDNSDIPLAFQHALTGVRIKAPIGASVTSVTISGVYDSATLSLNASELEWTSLTKSSATPSFTADVSSASVWDTSDTEYQILKDGCIFLMLPQWLPAGAKIAITIDDTTVEADLSGHEWKMGKLVTYRVARETREYHIEVEVTGELSADGIPKPVATLNSYAVPEGGGDAVSAAFRVKGAYSTRELAESGGTPDLDGSWTTSVDGNTLSVGAPAATPVSKTVTTLLEEAPEWGTSSHPWNLANRLNGGDAIVESANTYLVNAPGYYRIPLVIGNGVKNGEANTDSYQYGGATNFVDYKGQSIQNPYLHKSSAQAGTPTSGAVVWTETPGMVENLSVVSTGEGNDRVYWLQFHIPASKIAQGCTVVSVKDAGGTVIWSWLLWATDLEPGTGDVTCTWSSEGDQLSFLSRNLGWSVDTALPGVMPAEVAFVRVEVEANPEVYEIIRIRRAGGFSGELPHEGHGPLFQWGRKDAMPPTATGWNYRSAGTKKPEDLIQYPGHHFTVSYYPYCNDGGKLVATNWWSASATAAGQDVATVKTAYDPCPAGYTVPRHNAFNGFSCEPVVQNDPNNTLPEISLWDGTNLGYSFNTGYRASGSGHVYFPAQGHRNGGATSATIGTSEASFGRYWTAVPQGGNTARRLTFEFGAVNHPQNNSAGYFSKAGEHSIRPAVEE